MISTNKRITPFFAILVFFFFIFGCNQDPSTLSFENQAEVQLAKGEDIYQFDPTGQFIVPTRPRPALLRWN